MTVAHSSSWPVITGIGLMLIGAALQWANKVVLIGGQGHISRTLQIEASAHSRAIANKHIHTHTHVRAQSLDKQWHLCFSAAV